MALIVADLELSKYRDAEGNVRYQVYNGERLLVAAATTQRQAIRETLRSFSNKDEGKWNDGK